MEDCSSSETQESIEHGAVLFNEVGQYRAWLFFVLYSAMSMLDEVIFDSPGPLCLFSTRVTHALHIKQAQHCRAGAFDFH